MKVMIRISFGSLSLQRLQIGNVYLWVKWSRDRGRYVTLKGHDLNRSLRPNISKTPGDAI